MERTIQPLTDNVNSDNTGHNAQTDSNLVAKETLQTSQPISNGSYGNQFNPPTSVANPQPLSGANQGTGAATVYTAPLADIPVPETKSTTPAPTQYLTVPQLEQVKTKLPIGIYFIQAWAVIGLVLDQLGISQVGVYSTIALFIDLLLCVGLIFRLETARKLMIWLSAGTVILSVISVLLLVGVQQRLKVDKDNFQYAVSKINQAQETLQQRQQISNLQAKLNEVEKQAGKSIYQSYFKEGVTAIAEVGVIVYLTRPKVKGVFRELEK